MTNTENSNKSNLPEQSADETAAEEVNATPETIGPRKIILADKAQNNALEVLSPEESTVTAETPATEEPMTLEAMATGDDKVMIISHRLYINRSEAGEVEKAGVKLSIKNTCGTIIGTTTFVVDFFNQDGNIVDTVEHHLFEFSPKTNECAVDIASKNTDPSSIVSYNARLVRTTLPPKPVAKGNDIIAITKHKFTEVQVYMGINQFAAELVIKNISGVKVGTIIFEADFYDRDGNIVDTVTYQDTNLKRDQSRGVSIYPKITEPGLVRSYNVRVIRAITTNVEKLHMTKRDVKQLPDGSLDIFVTAKNISEEKTDAALVATFFNVAKETIGTKIVIQKEVEPDSSRDFRLTYNPPPGDTADGCTVKIVGHIETL